MLKFSSIRALVGAWFDSLKHLVGHCRKREAGMDNSVFHRSKILKKPNPNQTESVHAPMCCRSPASPLLFLSRPTNQPKKREWDRHSSSFALQHPACSWAKSLRTRPIAALPGSAGSCSFEFYARWTRVTQTGRPTSVNNNNKKTRKALRGPQALRSDLVGQPFLR